MRKQSLIGVVAGPAALVTGPSARADYSNTVISLNPVAYWPLNEATAPGAGVTTATNHGTLGTSFNATFQGNVSFGLPGAIVSEADTADGFDGASAMAATPYGPPVANGPSFTIEAWLQTHDTSNLQCPLSDVEGSSPRAGWLIYLNISNPGQYTLRTYAKNGTSASLSMDIGAANSITADQWYHLAIVVSNAVTVTNVYAYLNGALVAGPVVLPAFVPNDGLNGSFAIGARSDHGFFFHGNVDEVAYYTNALDGPTILAHYTAGTSVSPVNPYETLVQLSNPILYFRLDEPNILPVAHNYGTLGAAVNGNYEAGTVPGVAGPSFFGLPSMFGANNFACQFSPGGTQSSTSPGPGVACDPSNLSALDNQSNLTLSAWVKVPASAVGWFTGPCGRGDSSYRFGLDTSGQPHFADGGNSDIVGFNAVNDGYWHLWTGVYNAVNSNATFYIDTTVVGSTVWNPPGGTAYREFFIGGAPDYIGRNFVGTVSHVAIFTNALSSTQIGQLYYSAAPPLFNQAVASQNPIGYWPLNETSAPPDPVTVTFTNYGTLGASFNGSEVGDVIFGYPGALASSTDSADSFPVNALAQVPYTSDLANPPSFTIEAWLLAHDDGSIRGTLCPLSDFDANSPRSGWLIYLNIDNVGQYTFRAYATNGTSPSLNMDIGAPGSIKVEQWNHLVVVVSNALTVTNVYGYLNGALVAGPVALPAYVPNDGLAGGFSIGARADTGFHFPGAIDEVAYYTNALDAATVLAHYQAGTNPSPVTAYATLVQQQHPILYYRMDEATRLSSPYPVNLPVAANYGALGAAAQGYYQPGTTPGVPGPTAAGFGPNSLACSLSPGGTESTSQAGPGVMIAPYAESLINAPGALTLSAWIQIPAGSVGWFQTPIGRGDNSYRMDAAAGGIAHFAANPNGDLVALVPLNDGAWHFWAGVFDPASHNATLYIDGLPQAEGSWAPLADLTGYLLVGGAPDYVDRNFVGNVCEVALFTNALSPSQIAAVYDSIGTAPATLVATNQFYINEGANGTFTAQVVGTPPLAMQWYYIDTLNNTNLASGQTTPTLSITNAQTSQSGDQFYLVVGNSYGTVTSSIVTLNVLVGPPTIQVDVAPPLQYVPAGTPLSYSVEVTGSTPFHYQWYSNSVPVGADTNFFGFNAAPGSNYFYCTISNSHGPVTSSTAAVIAGTPPPILDFSSTTGWTLNGSGVTPAINSGVLTLTDGNNGEAASAFYFAKQYAGGFITFFTYQEANGSAPLADGTTFCLQNSPGGAAALGGGGGDLGYYGITSSAAFELNIYNGANGGIGIQFGTNGMTADSPLPTAPYFAPGPVNIASADPINVRLYYDGIGMHVLLVDATSGASYQTTFPGNMVGIVGAEDAYVGFTGATGGLNAIQNVSNFRFSYTTPPLMSVQRNGASAVISWPISVSTFFALQSAPTPTGPWSSQGGASVVNGQNQLTVTPTTARFYRLVLE